MYNHMVRSGQDRLRIIGSHIESAASFTLKRPSKLQSTPYDSKKKSRAGLRRGAHPERTSAFRAQSLLPRSRPILTSFPLPARAGDRFRTVSPSDHAN